ncbi:hypothetical protein [Ligilactobacillus murinus]|jgi:hypothetical protein|uniref:hypothetical protein n=1 Tax=Ligilactobacillus murinus TaxID=1622 RepID=UPI001094DB8F|nr:hypothetical protein [Ligilactobacillus murinus]TGY53594.1 hypothetical protein E5341_01865 [Ligilactobacillus murinus]
MTQEEYLKIYVTSLEIISKYQPCNNKKVIDELVKNDLMKKLVSNYGVNRVKIEMDNLFRNMLIDQTVIGKLTNFSIEFTGVTTNGYNLLELHEDNHKWTDIINDIKKEAPKMVASGIIGQIISRLFQLF